jgi:hypothetical protein
LIEDEEEDVVCAALESSLKIIKYFDFAFQHDKSQCEKYIVPIFSKIMHLYQGFLKGKDCG